MSSRYSIKDLEIISGIKAHTLRIWEQRYNILKPERTDTNIRYYSDADIKRILNISLLNANGQKISHIAKLNEKELVEEAQKFLGHYKNAGDQVDNLVLCLMDMDEDRFERTVNNAILHFGFESTMEKVIFPFLRHVGDLWQMGIISAAQEHYISNLIRQKLIVGIDKLVAPPDKQSKKYLFFLPASELHELGLLYTHYLTKARGHACVYLGQSVPLEDLIKISQTVKPDFLVSILTAPAQDMTAASLLKLCSEKIPEATFYISGRMLFYAEEQPTLPDLKFKVFKDFEAFKKLV